MGYLPLLSSDPGTALERRTPSSRKQEGEPKLNIMSPKLTSHVEGEEKDQFMLKPAFCWISWGAQNKMNSLLTFLVG